MATSARKAAPKSRTKSNAVAVRAVKNPVAAQLRGKGASFALFREDQGWLDWDPGQESFDRMLAKYGRSSTYVYIAISRNAISASQIPIIVINRKREGQPNAIIRDNDHGLLELLDRPNPYQSQMEFVEQSITSLELSGNLFIDKQDTNDDGRPEELYVLNPARITILPDPQKLVRGYIYNVNGKQIPLLPSQVLHIKYPHPLNDHYGLSKLTAARLAIETDRAAQEWNRTFLLKGGWPGGALETDADPDDDTVKRIKRQIKQSMSSGKDSAGRILFLTGGLKFNPISVNPKDADWLDARRMSRDEIFMIFGLPPAAGGAYTNENTTTRSAGVEQQIKQYYRGTVCALIKRLLDSFNRDFVRTFNPTYKLVPDLRNVPALQDDVQTEYTRAQALHVLTQAGLSLNKGLARLYPDVQPEPWGDAYFANGNTIPVTAKPLDGPPPEPTPPALPPPNGNGNTPPAPGAAKPKPGKSMEALQEAIDILRNKVDQKIQDGR